jgi:hypothetical protein
MLELKPPLKGVHLSLPSFEYLELQQPLRHSELVEQKAQSPSDAPPETQMSLRKPPLSGVHFNLPSLEYLELQHPLRHWELDEQKAQSPSSWAFVKEASNDDERPIRRMAIFMLEECFRF